jgi:solute carrier family 25 protein 39/40
VLSEAGPRGLFAGLGPRLAKVSPACAIMVGSYELGKAFFTHQNNTTTTGPVVAV